MKHVKSKKRVSRRRSREKKREERKSGMIYIRAKRKKTNWYKSLSYKSASVIKY